jgi:hypothetical protein
MRTLDEWMCERGLTNVALSQAVADYRRGLGIKRGKPHATPQRIGQIRRGGETPSFALALAIVAISEGELTPDAFGFALPAKKAG